MSGPEVLGLAVMGLLYVGVAAAFGLEQWRRRRQRQRAAVHADVPWERGLLTLDRPAEGGTPRRDFERRDARQAREWD